MSDRSLAVEVVRLDLDAAVPAASHACLSPGELARAERYHWADDRRRFLRRRIDLRTILGDALDIDGGSVSILQHRQGKPVLGPAHAGAGLRFNTSSSGGLGLVALAWGRDVGVDIERRRVHDDLELVVRRFFSAAERRLVLDLEGQARVDAFYACWTLKEAFVKARGDGLSLALEDFDVDPRAGEGSALAATRWDPAEARRWHLRALPAPAGHAAAIAIAGPQAARVRLRSIDVRG